MSSIRESDTTRSANGQLDSTGAWSRVLPVTYLGGGTVTEQAEFNDRSIKLLTPEELYITLYRTLKHFKYLILGEEGIV